MAILLLLWRDNRGDSNDKHGMVTLYNPTQKACFSTLGFSRGYCLRSRLAVIRQSCSAWMCWCWRMRGNKIPCSIKPGGFRWSISRLPLSATHGGEGRQGPHRSHTECTERQLMKWRNNTTLLQAHAFNSVRKLSSPLSLSITCGEETALFHYYCFFISFSSFLSCILRK